MDKDLNKKVCNINYFKEVCKIYRGEQKTRLDLDLKTQSVVQDPSTSLLLHSGGQNLVNGAYEAR